MELVTTYLDSVGIDYKQLVETDRPEREQVLDVIKKGPSGTNQNDPFKNLGTN